MVGFPRAYCAGAAKRGLNARSSPCLSRPVVALQHRPWQRARMLVKKYSNRRLYDTEASRYITIGELTDHIQRGAEVTIVDAKTGVDLTQVTLTQVIVE